MTENGKIKKPEVGKVLLGESKKQTKQSLCRNTSSLVILWRNSESGVPQRSRIRVSWSMSRRERSLGQREAKNTAKETKTRLRLDYKLWERNTPLWRLKCWRDSLIEPQIFEGHTKETSFSRLTSSDPIFSRRASEGLPTSSIILVSWSISCQDIVNGRIFCVGLLFLSFATYDQNRGREFSLSASLPWCNQQTFWREYKLKKKANVNSKQKTNKPEVDSVVVVHPVEHDLGSSVPTSRHVAGHFVLSRSENHRFIQMFLSVF